jgi:hypothetical protein
MKWYSFRVTSHQRDSLNWWIQYYRQYRSGYVELFIINLFHRAYAAKEVNH